MRAQVRHVQLAAGAHRNSAHEYTGQRLQRAFAAIPCAGDQVQVDLAAIELQRRNVAPLQPGVGRRRHLQASRQVDPELQDFELAALFAKRRRRYFGMHDAAAGRHPLHAAGADDALVPGAILVHQGAVDDEGHGVEAAVRMRPERQATVARRVVLRTMVIEKQEGIDLLDVRSR
nr:hypothetical protein [Massilia rubra]